MSRPPVSVVIFAKRDERGTMVRRAQFDLLCRSLQMNWPDATLHAVIDQPAGETFTAQWRGALADAEELVCFATDDGVFYRPVDALAALLLEFPDVLCVSTRLGSNTTYCYPEDREQHVPGGLFYKWLEADGDFGYPGSIDGTIFRRSDLLKLLGDVHAGNPTELEATLNARCHERLCHERPLIARQPRSSYVCVPVNRVSDQSGVRAGVHYPQGAEALSAAYDNGGRISLERTFYPSFVSIDSCHFELPFVWDPAAVEA